MEVDDDVFFADLSKQISLLIMDDDDDEIPPVSYYPSVALQGISRTIVVHPTTESPYHYDQNFRREVSKGTGVFIPKSSQWRRKNRQRFNSQNTNNMSYRQLPDNSTSGVSTAYNNHKKY